MLPTPKDNNFVLENWLSSLPIIVTTTDWILYFKN